MKTRSILLLLLFVSLASFVTSGETEDPKFEEKDTPAMVKASYIYNFAKLIDWPSSYKKGNFIIGVMSETSMYQELVSSYNGKSIGSQPIEIRKISSTLNFTNCHILFVDHGFGNFLPEIKTKVANASTLIVSQDKGALSKGSAINLVLIDSNLKFEMSVNNAESQSLFVGSSLKGLAIHLEN